MENQLSIPPGRKLENSVTVLPLVFVGDEIFGLQQNFLKPYSRKYTDQQSKVFNYRLSRARTTIERAFGRLTSKWRVIRSHIGFDLETVESIVGACICLHNYFTRDQIIDNNDENYNENVQQHRRMHPVVIRHKFAECFLLMEILIGNIAIYSIRLNNINFYIWKLIVFVFKPFL